MYTIAELLIMKRSMCNVMIHTYASLKPDLAANRLSKIGMSTGDKERKPHVIRLYDEREKNEKLDEWMTLKSEIDGRLEVVNAVTDLLVE